MSALNFSFKPPFFPPKPKFSFILKGSPAFLTFLHVSSSLQASLVSLRLVPSLSNLCRVYILHNPLCVSFSSMYIFGGFSGLLLNDVLSYTPPSCQAFLNSASCAAAGPGLRCHWVKTRCVPWEPKPPEHISPAPFCPARPGTFLRGSCLHS